LSSSNGRPRSFGPSSRIDGRAVSEPGGCFAASSSPAFHRTPVEKTVPPDRVPGAGSDPAARMPVPYSARVGTRLIRSPSAGRSSSGVTPDLRRELHHNATTSAVDRYWKSALTWSLASVNVETSAPEPMTASIAGVMIAPTSAAFSVTGGRNVFPSFT